MIYDDGEPLPDRAPETDDGAKGPKLPPTDWEKEDMLFVFVSSDYKQHAGYLPACAAHVVAWLQANPQLRAEVLGHVDHRARLAEERADVAFRDVERLAALLAAERARVAELEATGDQLAGVAEAVCKEVVALALHNVKCQWDTARRRSSQQPSPPPVTRMTTREAGDRFGPKCWCHRCEDADPNSNPFSTRMILCPNCGNKRCPKAAWHDYQCTGSNEPGQVGVTEDKRLATEEALARGEKEDWSKVEPGPFSGPEYSLAAAEPAEPANPSLPGSARCEIVVMPGRMGGSPTLGDSRLPLRQFVAEARASSIEDMRRNWPQIPESTWIVVRAIAEELRPVPEDDDDSPSGGQGQDYVTVGQLIVALRRVGAFGFHISGPAALERLADELERKQ